MSELSSTESSIMMKCIILCVGFLITGTLAGVDFIKPCRITDSECIMESTKIALPYLIPGVKELGLQPIDPLTVKDINVDTGELKLLFKDIVVYNLSKCIINKIERDPVKSTALFDIQCGIKFVGNYKIGGKLLFVDVEGEGPFEIKGDKINVVVNIRLKTITKEGKQYYKFSGFDFTYTPITKFSINLKNLYNGDRAKAEPIEKILDESWKELINDPNIGKPIISGLIQKLVKIIDKLFQSIPKDEIEIA